MVTAIFPVVAALGMVAVVVVVAPADEIKWKLAATAGTARKSSHHHRGNGYQGLDHREYP